MLLQIAARTQQMKIAIVHLSDIHFRTRKDVCLRRADKLTNAIKYARDPEEKLVLVVTGDIANTGVSEEYEIAGEFFRSLFIGLGVNPAGDPSEAIFIPGNHDCNFKLVGDLRPRLLEDITTQLENIDAAGETAQTLLQVQAEFFKFQESLTGKQVAPDAKLYFSRRIEVGEKTIEFRCFNSAWLSSRHEDPGNLGFPQSTIRAASAPTDSEVVISIVHHPSNWLDPATHNLFRTTVQQISDFMFTGHEHATGGQIIASFNGTNLIHFESGPFQPTDSGESEFGILHIDLAKRKWKHDNYRWSNGAYSNVRVEDWNDLFDKSRRAASLQLTSSFSTKLNETGAGFLHPRKHSLTLSDIYVYPDLKRRALSRKLLSSEDLPKEIPSIEVSQKLLKAKRVAIAGPNDSGKTALGKMLFQEANTKYGRCGLLLNAKNFEAGDPVDSFLSAVRAAVAEQYGRDASGGFQGLDPSERVLIVDDWEDFQFGRAGRAAILARAAAQFGTIILLIDDAFLMDEVSARHEHLPLAGFEVVDIREFGFRLRAQLIRKWHSLSNTFIEVEETLARNIADSSRVVDTVLGRNLLPANPISILTLLQTYDSESGSATGGLGSYGQVYEALITARLAKVSLKSIDIGTKITFLARFAWRLFESGKRCIDENDWTQLCDQYFQDYKVRLDRENLLSSCISAGILSAEECGSRFTYGYGYCYFVAKYFQENLADPYDEKVRAELFTRLKSISERVYNQVNANIVIFYVFLTKDRVLIDHVISNARKIFEDSPEFDFDSHVQFANRIIVPPSRVCLPESTTETNQDSYQRRRDESGEQIEPNSDPSVGDVIYGPDIPIEQKLVIGFRFIALMGQILRNFPGSLKAETKLELAFETYALGLRILATIFILTERDSNLLANEIASVIKEKLAFTGTERQLMSRVEDIITDLLRNVVFGVVKRLSHAVGLSELEVTYEEVAALRDNNLANKFVDLSIRLDHFQRFPKSQIEDLAERLDGNNFSFHTLQDLVMNHLYLFPRSYALQQWAGSTLEMKVNIPRVRGSEGKMLGSGTPGVKS
jgi:hypothetical protein